jgi:hypothetical protein
MRADVGGGGRSRITESVMPRAKLVRGDGEAERVRVDALDGRLEALASQLDDMKPAVDAWRRVEVSAQKRLRDAVEQLVARSAEAAALAAQLNRLTYEQQIPRFRSAVEAAVPRGSVVLVVSKGDPRLLELRGRRGWHFLQNAEGVYAGHHPASSASAIEELEKMRMKGAAYLAFPKTAFWWLEHYAAFTDYLNDRFRLVARDERTTVIYGLNQPCQQR